MLHGAETLYLLKEQPAVSRIPVTLVTDIGVRLPAHLTANGRSILAHLSAAQVRALFPSARGFVDRTGQGPATLPELRRVLAGERQRKWAEEIGLVTPGLRSVAACVFDHSGWPCAAISVTWREDQRACVASGTGARGARRRAAADRWACPAMRPTAGSHGSGV